MFRPNDWEEADSKDNATATATHTKEANRRHVITLVSASFSVANIKLLQLKRATTVVLEFYVHNAEVVPVFLRGATNEDVSAVLAASGTSTEIGKVNIHGYTD